MTTTKTMLTGHAAIEHVATHGGDLGKFADPIEDAMYPVSLASAREIAREDPGLIYWLDDDALRTLRTEAGQAGDLAQGALCRRASLGDPDAWAECANVIRRAQAQEG